MFNKSAILSMLTAAFMHLNCIARATETPLPLHLYPADQQVKEGEIVTWYLTAAGTEPLQYQWKRDGKEIPGAIGNTLRIGSAKSSDQGVYTCRITNAAGNTETQAVALKVEAGTAFVENQPVKSPTKTGASAQAAPVSH